MSKIGNTVPQVTFRVRVRDESIGGDNPFRWQDFTTDDYFKNKKVLAKLGQNVVAGESLLASE